MMKLSFHFPYFKRFYGPYHLPFIVNSNQLSCGDCNDDDEYYNREHETIPGILEARLTALKQQ